jgi:Transglutaminase-like superfamily
MVSQHIRIAWHLSCILSAIAGACLSGGHLLAQPPRAPAPSEAAPAAATEGTSPEEIAKLVRLLDADRFEDRERATRRLAEIGLPALEALAHEQQEGSSEARRRAGVLVRSLVHGPRLRELAAFAALPDDKLDVERGMWHIARTLQPDVKFEELTKQLDDLALRVRQRLGVVEPAKANPQQVVAAICGVLFLEHGFNGNPNDYHNPDNSSLARVLATRKGLQITLSHICLAVARRLDVPLVSVPASLNYIVKYDGSRAPAGYPKEDIYFHPYQRGRLLSRADRQREFPMHDPDKMVPPDTSRQSLTRMLRNLMTALGENRRGEQLKEAEEFFSLLTAFDKKLER